MARQDRRLRVLLCNVHATSNPRLFTPWLMALCFTLRVDVVLLQEVTPGHRRKLERRKRWNLIEAGGCAVMARKALAWDWPRVVELGTGWFGWRTGRQHAGRQLPTVRVGGWLRVGSIHMPPGVGFNTAGDMTGPADRQDAWETTMVDLDTWLDRRPEHPSKEDPQVSVAELLGGDWNEPTLSTGKHSPSWLAARHGLRLVGRGIDYVAARGCTVASWRILGMGPGGDHRPRLYVVER